MSDGSVDAMKEMTLTALVMKTGRTTAEATSFPVSKILNTYTNKIHILGQCAIPYDMGNKVCQDVNNTPECFYDGGDCCNGIGQKCDCPKWLDCTCHENGLNYCPIE